MDQNLVDIFCLCITVPLVLVFLPICILMIKHGWNREFPAAVPKPFIGENNDNHS